MELGLAVALMVTADRLGMSAAIRHWPAWAGRWNDEAPSWVLF